MRILKVIFGSAAALVAFPAVLLGGVVATVAWPLVLFGIAARESMDKSRA